MSLVGNRFIQRTKSGLALAPQSVNNATVNGPTISMPWRDGRIISFQLLQGALASGVVGACTVQVQQKSDDAWVALKDNQATPADLVFTASKLADDQDNTLISGEVDLRHVDGALYKAMRLSYTESGAAAALVAGSYTISDLYSRPSDDVDDFNSKLNP